MPRKTPQPKQAEPEELDLGLEPLVGAVDVEPTPEPEPELAEAETEEPQLETLDFGEQSADLGQGNPYHFPSWEYYSWSAWRAWPGYDSLEWGHGHLSSTNLLVSAALVASGHAPHGKKRVDCSWSRLDDAALEAFKQSYNIREGGVGPLTWMALGTALRRGRWEHVDEIEVGSRSRDVLETQAMLVLQGRLEAATDVWTSEAAAAAAGL